MQCHHIPTNCDRIPGYRKEAGVNIHKHACAINGCAVDKSTIRHWAQKIKASECGEIELHDLPCSGHTAKATSPGMLNLLMSLSIWVDDSQVNNGPYSF